MVSGTGRRGRAVRHKHHQNVSPALSRHQCDHCQSTSSVRLVGSTAAKWLDEVGRANREHPYQGSLLGKQLHHRGMGAVVSIVL